MDYLREINAFYDLDIANQLTPNATLLYFALLNIANRMYWRADFAVSNLKLCSLAGIKDRRTFERARNLLVQKGLIGYKPSEKKKQTGTYTVIGCRKQLEQQDEVRQKCSKNAAVKDGSAAKMLRKCPQSGTDLAAYGDALTPAEDLGDKPSGDRKTKQNINKKPLRGTNVPNPDVNTFLKHYHQQFEQRFSTPPVVDWGKDGKIVKDLLERQKIPLSLLEELLEAFFDSEDSWIRSSGYTIGAFKSQINKLLVSVGNKKRRVSGFAPGIPIA